MNGERQTCPVCGRLVMLVTVGQAYRYDPVDSEEMAALRQQLAETKERAEEADERRRAWRMQAEKVERECESIRRQASQLQQALETERAANVELRRLLTEFRVVMGGQQTGSFHAEDLVDIWLEVCAYLDNAALATDAGQIAAEDNWVPIVENEQTAWDRAERDMAIDAGRERQGEPTGPIETTLDDDRWFQHCRLCGVDIEGGKYSNEEGEAIPFPHKPGCPVLTNAGREGEAG